MSAVGFWSRFRGGPADGQMLLCHHDPTRPVENWVAKRPARYQDIVRPLTNRFDDPTGIEVIYRYKLQEDDQPFWTYRLVSVHQSMVDVIPRPSSLWSYSSDPRLKVEVA